MRRIARMTQHIPRTPRTTPAMVDGANPTNSDGTLDPEVLAAISEDIDADASEGNSSPGWSI